MHVNYFSYYSHSLFQHFCIIFLKKCWNVHVDLSEVYSSTCDFRCCSACGDPHTSLLNSFHRIHNISMGHPDIFVNFIWRSISKGTGVYESVDIPAEGYCAVIRPEGGVQEHGSPDHEKFNHQLVCSRCHGNTASLELMPARAPSIDRASERKKV